MLVSTNFGSTRRASSSSLSDISFRRNEAQKQEIKKALLQHKDLYEVIEEDLERFAALFPAHPRFIDEFQNVVVVERREILTLLSKEGQMLLECNFEGESPELITSDRYWKHIEADAGLNANQDVSQVKRNISTLKNAHTQRVWCSRGQGGDNQACRGSGGESAHDTFY